MNAVELELVCPCGHENFERIEVQRKPNPPVVTDFAACVGCKAMYWASLPAALPVEQRPGHEMKGIGGQERG